MFRFGVGFLFSELRFFVLEFGARVSKLRCIEEPKFYLLNLKIFKLYCLINNSHTLLNFDQNIYMIHLNFQFLNDDKYNVNKVLNFVVYVQLYIVSTYILIVSLSLHRVC